MPDIVQVTVHTTTKDLFRFMLFHAYSKVSGLVTLVFSVICLIMLPVSVFSWKDPLTTAAFAIIVVLYLILTPLNMLSQSKRQVLSNPVFKNPITYHISEEIFEVQQYTGTVRLFWGQLIKVRKTPYDYLFYVNTEQAFVMPKTSVDPDEVKVLDEIIEKVSKEVGTSKKAIDEKQVMVKNSQPAPKKGRKKSTPKTKGDSLEKRLMEMAAKDSEDGQGLAEETKSEQK